MPYNKVGGYIPRTKIIDQQKHIVKHTHDNTWRMQEALDELRKNDPKEKVFKVSEAGTNTAS